MIFSIYSNKLIEIKMIETTHRESQPNTLRQDFENGIQVLTPSAEQLALLNERFNAALSVIDELDRENGGATDARIAEVVRQAARTGYSEEAAALGVIGVTNEGQQTETAAILATDVPVVDLGHALQAFNGAGRRELAEEAVDEIMSAVEGAGQLNNPENLSDASKKMNDYLDRKGIFGVDEVLRYVDILPPLDEPTAERLARMVSWRDRSSLGRILLAEPRLTNNAQFMADHFIHPERMANIFQHNRRIARSMSELRYHSFRDSVLDGLDKITDESKVIRLLHYLDVLTDPNATETAKSMADAVLQIAPFAEMGEVGHGPVAHVGDASFLPKQNMIFDVPIPLASRLPRYTRDEALIEQKPLKEMTRDELMRTLRPDYTEAHTNKDGTIDISQVSLPDLYGEIQELLLAERVERARSDSNRPELLASASARNKKIVLSGDVHALFSPNTLLHTTHPQFTKNILQKGLICGELAGASTPDAFPFGVDFYKLNRGDVGTQFDIRNISSRIHNDSVTLVMDRDDQSVKEYPDRVASAVASPDNRHVVVLGAVPSTEIKGVIAHGDSTQRDILVRKLSTELAEHGLYIAIVSEAGELLFTPDEYDALVSKQNQGIGGISVSEQVTSSEEQQKNEQRDPVPPWERGVVDDIPAFLV